ncbi:MAG: endolytic transglycosylase MltG [Treponema sp.]|nr:endolytic transglycosylase MltG [Treponema sp.]
MSKFFARGRAGNRRSFIAGLFRILSFLLGCCIFLLAAGFGVLVYFNAPPSGPVREDPAGALRVTEDGAALIEVRKGESGLSVGKRLEEAGIIRNRYFWYFISRLDSQFVKSGTFRLELPAGQLAIRKALVEGRQMLERVTIPEGFTLKKTAALLEAAGICDSEGLLLAARDSAILQAYAIPGPSLEGYLFPDTYLFPKDYPAALVVRALADNFFSHIGDTAIRGEELQRLVTLASIVEREYRVADEAPLMAGVFLNRLRIGMALQSCATVEYVITEIQGKPHPALIYTRDTEIQDPYNTYVNPGLPPGPICSPGALALEAVLRPQESDYLYFRLVDSGAGRHYFSKTFDDHIRAGFFYTKGTDSRP